MGQASSVQREPSMEEILASIRRIIEDSDASRKNGAEPAPHGPATSAEQPDIAAFRNGLHEQGQAEASVPDAFDQFGTASGYPAAFEPAAVPPDEPAPAAGFSFSSPDTLRPSGQPMQIDEIEMELDIGGLEEAAAEAGADQRPAILSEVAGRQVAASFGELNEALAARSRKSVDQMAEEMLRPMLQDWLDNNLPHLVEKLVREEIERIARGSAPR